MAMAEQRCILHPIMARPSIPTVFGKGPLHQANIFDERQDTQTQDQTETIGTNRDVLRKQGPTDDWN